VSLGVTLGLASTSVGPWIIGGLVDTHHFDVEQASLMVALEQVTMGVVMIVLAATLHRLPRRTLLVVGVLLALIAQALSYMLDGVTSMAVSRMLSGVAFAFVYATSTALGASTRDPDRTFAAAQFMAQVGTMAVNPLLGVGSELPGHKGVFAVLGGFTLTLAVPFLVLALRQPAANVERSTQREQRLAPWSRTVLGVLVLMTAYSLATGGAWNFVERVAASVGVRGAQLGSGMLAAGLIGTLGSVLANRLGTTHGRVGPLCGGLLGLGLATLWLMAPSSPLQFWIALSLWSSLFTFTTPYVFGLAAAADRTGRLVAATGTAYIIVSALGAYFAGFIAAHSGLTPFGVVALMMLAAAMVPAALVSRSVPTAQAAAGAAPLSSG
jgi:predicted MFS family arabinose efflux permease